MKRTRVSLVVALFFLFALRYAFGQAVDENSGVGWDSISFGGYDPVQDIVAVMIGAPILGVVIGAIRVLTQRPGISHLQLIKLS